VRCRSWQCWSAKWLVMHLIEDGAVQGGHLLGIQPWTQWLTWGSQVMPLFFLVGGFQWRIPGRRQPAAGIALCPLVHQPVPPPDLTVLPLLQSGRSSRCSARQCVEPQIVALAIVALIPVWFLSVYIMVTAAVPLTHTAWKRWGFGSFFALVAGAIAVNLHRGVRVRRAISKFTNFAFVWPCTSSDTPGAGIFCQARAVWHGVFRVSRRCWRSCYRPLSGSNDVPGERPWSIPPTLAPAGSWHRPRPALRWRWN
jgi:hypothetical protein